MFLFLYGDSSFLSRKRLEKIKNDFFIKNTSNANSMVFDFDEKISFGELKTAIKAEGLFSSKKIVVVKNMIKSSNKEVQDELVDYLQKNDISQDLTLVFWEEGEPKKNNKLFKEFLKKFKIERFDKLSGRSLVNWAAGEANKSGLEIEENISFAWARHSFATISILAGVRLELVSKQLTHTSLETTMLYFKGFEDDTYKQVSDKILDFSKKTVAHDSKSLTKCVL